MPLIVCDKAEKANRLLKDIALFKSLKTIVVMDGVGDVDTSLAKHVNIVSFGDVLVGRLLST